MAGADPASETLRSRYEMPRFACDRIRSWDLLQRPLLWIVIQVATEHHRSGFREVYEQDLMARRVARRAFDDHVAISENVVVPRCDERRPAVFQRAEVRRLGSGRGGIR